MHKKSIIIFFAFFFISTASAKDEIVCGLNLQDLEGIALSWYSLLELEETYEIALDEAVVWEYSNSEYCGSEEYEVFAELTSIKDDRLFLRRNSIESKDQCQLRKISLTPSSPIEFLTKFNRRLVSTRVDGVLTTWYVIRDKVAIKFQPQLKTHECLEYGI